MVAIGVMDRALATAPIRAEKIRLVCFMFYPMEVSLTSMYSTSELRNSVRGACEIDLKEWFAIGWCGCSHVWD